MKHPPREFQVLAVNEVDGWRAQGVRSGIVQAPTGAGKTLVGMLAAQRWVQAGQRGGFLVHRDHLVSQAQEQAHDLGLHTGVIKSGWPADASAPLQIASVQTLTARKLHPAWDFVIGDECHLAHIYGHMSKFYDDTFRLGLTATPESSGGRTLVNHFQRLHIAVKPSTLLDRGWVVPPRMWVPEYPDLSHIRVMRGEFNEADLAMAMRGLVGSVVGHWQRHLRGKKVLTFAVNREHAKHLETNYREAGARVGVIDGTTPDSVRAGLMAHLSESTLDVLINVAVFIEGYNLPDLDCVTLATASNSLSRVLQMCGRACRAVPGKTHYTLVDHGGNIFRHMPPHIDRRWALDPEGQKEARKTRVDNGVRWCKVCFHVYELGPGSMTCPHCKTTAPVRVVRERAGRLVDITNMVDIAALSSPQQQTKDHADAYRRKLWAKANAVRIQNPHAWVQREMDKFWAEVLKKP